MKRVLAFGVFGILLISLAAFVIAESNDSNDSSSNSSLSEQIRNNIQDRQQIRNDTRELRDDIRNNLTNFTEVRKDIRELRREFVQNIHQRNEIRKDIREMIKNNETFTYVDENGTETNFTKVDGQLRLREGNHSIRSNLNITIDVDENNRTMLTVTDGNRTKEIKIMPNTAAERALERLSLKNCNTTNNCTIELKDVGKNMAQKLQYEIQVQRHYKILGLFDAKADNKATVDAETGQVVVTKQPWWSFLASKKD